MSTRKPSLQIKVTPRKLNLAQVNKTTPDQLIDTPTKSKSARQLDLVSVATGLSDLSTTSPAFLKVEERIIKYRDTVAILEHNMKINAKNHVVYNRETKSVQLDHGYFKRANDQLGKAHRKLEKYLKFKESWDEGTEKQEQDTVATTAKKDDFEKTAGRSVGVSKVKIVKKKGKRSKKKKRKSDDPYTENLAKEEGCQE